MLFKRRGLDITGGPLFRSIITYSIPIIIGALISNLFHSADMIVLGQMADVGAVSAVGVTSTPVSLIVNTFIGLGSGVTIQLSRATGAGDRDRIRRIVNTSVITAFVLGILVMLLGVILHKPILNLVKCPDSAFDNAATYLKIYLIAAPAILVYNFGNSILRVHGDSERPLYYLIASGILNVVLNVIFCFTFANKVAAVALATVLSQYLGAVLVLIRLSHGEKGEMHLNLSKLTFDFGVLKRIMWLGIPGAINTALFSFGNLPLRQAINMHGEAVIAGDSACISIEGLINSFTTGIGTAASVFVGQNIGAGRVERVKKTILSTVSMNFFFALLMALLIPLAGKPLLGLFLRDEAAIAAGYIRMQWVVAFYFIVSINHALNPVINAFGYVFLCTINTLAWTLGFRYVWIYLVYPNYGTLECIYLGVVLSFSLVSLSVIPYTFILYRRYKKGKIMKV